MHCSSHSPAKSERWPISPPSSRRQKIRRSRRWRRSWSRKRPSTSISYIDCCAAIRSRALPGPMIWIHPYPRNSASGSTSHRLLPQRKRARSIGLVAPIYHPHGFALRARQLARRLDGNMASDADQRFDMLPYFFGFAAAAGVRIAGTRRQLDLYRHGVERTFPRQYNLVVRRQPGEADQHGFHLRRIDVHPADDEHVVIATGDAHDANMAAAARTRFIAQPSDIARSIANHRQRFLGERGDDQLAGFADRQRLQALGVDDFEDEMVFPTVQA